MFGLIIIIILTFLISFLTRGKIDDWYLSLNKSPLTPPGYIFGIVWPILYILMSIYIWIILDSLHQDKKILLPIILYIIQLILNFIWTPVFFNTQGKQIKIAFILLFIIWLLVFIIIIISNNKTSLLLIPYYNKASLLLIPYLIWLSFALYLNYYIIINN